METDLVSDFVIPMLVLLAVFVVVGILIFLVFWLPKMRHKHQAEGWSDWAGENGWGYEEKRPDMTGILFTAINQDMHSVQHVLSRHHRGCWVLTYEHVEMIRRRHGNDDLQDVRHDRRAVAVTLPAPVPRLDIGMETGDMSMNDLYKLSGASILETGHPAFDATFRVTTDNEAFARTVLTPAMMDRLLTRNAHGRPPVRFNGHYLVTAEDGRLEPDSALGVADELLDLVATVPAQVWQGNRQG